MNQESKNAAAWALLLALSLLACGGQAFLEEDVRGQASGGQASGGQASGGQASGGQSLTGYPSVALPPVRTVFPLQCLDVASGLAETKILPPKGATNYFGRAVALEGDLLLAADSNTVHVFRHRGSSWEREDSVSVVSGVATAMNLALSGESFAVGLPWGATQPGGVPPGAVITAGSASTYRLGSNGPVFDGELSREGAGNDLYFGGGIALDGATLVVASATDLAIYERQATGFVELQRIQREDPFPGGGFFPVALAADVLVAGAWWTQHADGKADGIAHVFRRQGGAFQLESTLRKAGTMADFGTSLALGDDFLAVSGPKPVVFSPMPDFSQEVTLPIPTNYSSVFADASTVVAATDDSFRLFQREAGNWVAGPVLSPHDRPEGYALSGPVALSDDRLVIGVDHDSSTTQVAGAIYVFEASPGFVGPTCYHAGEPPSRIPGNGVGCQDSGDAPLHCRFLEPSESSLLGLTPYGAVAMPFVYADSSDEGGPTELVFSNLAPRGAATRPLLIASIEWTLDAPIPLGVPMQRTFLLELCDRTEEVEGTLTLHMGTQTASRIAPPLEGEVHIHADGWALDGDFRVNDFCGWLDPSD